MDEQQRAAAEQDRLRSLMSEKQLRSLVHSTDRDDCLPGSRAIARSIQRQGGRIIGYLKDGRPIISVQGGASVWRQPLLPMAYASGTAVTAAALTSGLGGLSPPQLPAIFLQGAVLTIKVWLEITSGSATPTNTMDLRMGSVGQAIASKTVIAGTGALALPASVTAGPAYMEWTGQVRAISPTAMSLYGQGIVKNVSSLTAFIADAPFPATAAARTVSTFNSSQANELDFGITLSVTTGSPSVTVAIYNAELSG